MIALSRWLSRLQLSPRSQRVLTEAALDWRHEVATAETAWSAIGCHARGTLGVLRAGAMTVARETTDPAVAAMLGRVLIVLAVIALLPWLAGLDVAAIGSPNVRSLAIVSLTNILWRSLPEAAFIAIVLASRRAVSVAPGTLAGLLVAGLLIAGILQPLAWSRYATEGLLRPGLARPGVSFAMDAWVGALRLIGSVMLADRLRIDRRRAAIIVCLSVLGLAGGINVLVSVALANPSRLGVLMSAGGWRTASLLLLAPIGGVLQMARVVTQVIPVTLVAWYLLVRLQERTRNVTA